MNVQENTRLLIYLSKEELFKSSWKDFKFEIVKLTNGAFEGVRFGMIGLNTKCLYRS
jgi:hypothetical protein